jgi:hypothetical protein
MGHQLFRGLKGPERTLRSFWYGPQILLSTDTCIRVQTGYVQGISSALVSGSCIAYVLPSGLLLSSLCSLPPALRTDLAPL